MDTTTRALTLVPVLTWVEAVGVLHVPDSGLVLEPNLPA